MKIAAIALAALLAGCDTMTVAEKLPHLSNLQVCEGVMLAPPHVAVQAQGEAQRRGIDCAQYAGAVMQQRAASSNAMGNLAQQLLNPPQQPMQPMQPITNCRSFRVGNTVQTQCF